MSKNRKKLLDNAHRLGMVDTETRDAALARIERNLVHKLQMDNSEYRNLLISLKFKHGINID